MQNSNLETQQKEANGWQNVGICLNYAYDNIDEKLITVYLFLVKESFGKRRNKTNRITIKSIAEKLNLSRQTVSNRIDELIKIKALRSSGMNTYIKGGGSEPSEYYPELPKGYGFIHTIENEKKQSNNSGSEVTKEIVEPENEWDKNKNVDF